MTNHNPLVRLLMLIMPLLLLAACAAATAETPPAPSDTAKPTAAPSAAVVAAQPSSTTAPPTATPEPLTATPEPDELEQLDAAQRQPHDRVLLARALAGQPDAPQVASDTPLDVQVGHLKEFWVNSFVRNTNYQVTAELSYAGPVVLMYVEQGMDIDQGSLAAAAQYFEQQIYPRTRELFGSEWQPGVDGDPRIVILNLNSIDGGVIGYFSSRDSVPQSVNRFSNQHEMFYMNAGTVPPGSNTYLDTLAHEFQHMIHWNEQRNSSTWFNEGNSTLAQDLNGFTTQQYVATYLFDPDVQLTAWGDQPGESIAHYGASHLFMRYIYNQYAGEAALAELIRANAGNNLDAFVELAARTRPTIGDFGDLYADWAVANLLDDPQLADGQYGYRSEQTGITLLPAAVRPDELESSTVEGSVHQFGADYLTLPPGTTSLNFTGSTDVELVGALPQGDYSWWSGRSDHSVATLTRAFDLRGLDTATLTFDTWYEIEVGYDYAFATISTDGGTTWEILSGTHTTTDDPHGANYGSGYTGTSGLPAGTDDSSERGKWVQESIDLSPYAGQQVQVRFWQINDEGYNRPGMLLDNIAIPEAGYRHDVEQGADDWQAEGFVRVDGLLDQQWELRLVRTAASGTVTVETLPTDAQGQATATLSADDQGVLVVMATTPHTTETAAYTLVTK